MKKVDSLAEVLLLVRIVPNNLDESSPLIMIHDKGRVFTMWKLCKKKIKTFVCILVVAGVLGILYYLHYFQLHYRTETSEMTRESRRYDGTSDVNMVQQPIAVNSQRNTSENTLAMPTQEAERLQNFETEQKRRKDTIRKICEGRRAKSSSVTDLYDDTQRHIYVVDKYKLMFCYIPKVGCSNWKRILMILEDSSRTIEDIDSREAHARNKLTVLRRYPPKQREWRLKNYRKFMFVRHPLSRIVSAYKNKYADLSVFRTAPLELRRYATRIMKKYRKNPTEKELQTGENITWSEWLQYISDPTELQKFDRHWKEMYKLCSPCAIDYDYVGKLENMKEEADFITDKLEISNIVRYPGKGNSHPINTSVSGVEEKFKEATHYQLERISKIYALDFQLFGYTNPFHGQ